MGNGIVLAGEATDEERVVWDGLLVNRGDVFIDVFLFMAEVGTVAVVGVLALAARLPLVHPDGLPGRVSRFKAETESADTGKEFTYSLLHENPPFYGARPYEQAERLHVQSKEDSRHSPAVFLVSLVSYFTLSEQVPLQASPAVPSGFLCLSNGLCCRTSAGRWPGCRSSRRSADCGPCGPRRDAS